MHLLENREVRENPAKKIFTPMHYVANGSNGALKDTALFGERDKHAT